VQLITFSSLIKKALYIHQKTLEEHQMK